MLETYNNQLSEKQTELDSKKEDKERLLADIEQVELKILVLQQDFCVDDAECITISVVDTDGNPVENFELYINGGNAGFTDYKGEYKYTVFDASVNTEHNVQICYCFETKRKM
ncbi:MAG: hypothetical protein CM15mV42_0370 [uncultured marine virus]|nr:MAG: hypothetical protein CM15mV42_0370 [uncultured marine virus]